MRAIDADKLKDLEELEYKYFSSQAAVPFYEADKVWEILEAAPTISYEELVPHGRWVDERGNAVPFEDGGICPVSWCKCSVCGEYLTASDEYSVTGRYCPNCGAKMDGGKDNERT